MSEIEKRASSSDVSSNSSWTFVGEKPAQDDLAEEPGELKEEFGVEKLYAEEAEKPNVETDQKSRQSFHNLLQNSNCIGTLTVIGTVLALTGLSFLCALIPAGNPALTYVPDATNQTGCAIPLFQLDDGYLVMEDRNGALSNRLKEGSPFNNATAGLEKLKVDTAATYEEFLKSAKSSSEESPIESQKEIAAEVGIQVPSEKLEKEPSNSTKGSLIFWENVIRVIHYM